jgi:hypothetical protein
MPLDDYSEAELQPRNLTKEEIENPGIFIKEFFSVAHLPQWRDTLWQALRLIVIGDWKNLPTKEKASFMLCYETIAKLIEIAHVLNRRTTE